MFAKLFQNPTQSEPPRPSSQLDVAHESMASSDLAPRVAVHYGIPSTASILAYDPIQRLLAVGTLDGRIKVVGGDNIEGLLLSPKALPFKNLEVWDLEKRCIASNIEWESNITAFSVIYGTNYMYVGDEYGFLSVLKYDAEEGNISHLPYHVPPNLIAEGAGISLPDQQSIVGVVSQPSSCGNRVLIAYDNGLIILWDITEDRAVHVRGHKDLQLKEGMVVNFSNNERHEFPSDSLDDEEAEKEISSLCWVSPDGSVLAVGYVDGDILLWNLSVSDSDKGQRTQKSPNDVFKIQLSSGNKRLPVIVLHWSSDKAQNGCGGQLFVYGGEDIGSEEVLTILDLDWSSGLAKVKCIERVDLRLYGSFADVLVISNAYKAENNNAMSLFVLTNPGQLNFYEYTSLSNLKPEKGKDHSVHSFQYQSVIPTLEPYMTVGKLYIMGSERSILSALSETVSPAKQQSDDMLTGGSTKWPMKGGIPYRMSATECNSIERIYIGGYQDGSIRIWDATFPILSRVSVLGFEMESIQVAGASASISALVLCSASDTLAVGNECGVIFLYRLQGNLGQTTMTIVTEPKHEVHSYQPEGRNHCSTVYSILNSPVRALEFATSGVRLVAGFESGQVAVLDTTSPSVLFVMDCVSPVISLAIKSSLDTHENRVKNSGNDTESEPEIEIAFILTRDARMFLMDGATGNMISSQPIHPNEKSTAISMHFLEVNQPLAEGPKTQSESAQTSHQQNQSGVSKVEEATQPTNLEHKKVASEILLCCEEAFYLYSLKTLFQGNKNFIHEFKLEKPCSWASIVKRDAEIYGVIIVYQTGEIEMRSLPELKLLGNTSMMSTLRWNFKNNMDKTMSASDKGQIALVNGCEFAIVSLLAFENDLRIPETLPCLHDKVLAAAADADVNFSQNQKKSAVPGFVSNMIKGLKGVKEEQDMNYNEAREVVIAHLERIFSRFPFSDPLDTYDLDDVELQIDDINIDEPVPYVASSQKSGYDVKEKGKEREKLFEGGSTDTKPTVRTREEIIAKYRNRGDAAAAASQAKDKLLERQEKLEKLSRRTEELQSGAENFASMANELAKAMEKRKWWNI
ncbi:Tomosyn [Handroanthus impetiginosus]|uniref:Tomosyn n=1 Tax=Handroanthus impetiginosus TaxID=429701 RepID=A0A2G9GL45_9LAMI|nr:Tomosyn [Handroanthus impetiginosus]